MPRPDLNLLVTLDVLLAEGNVARAAKRMRCSPSAMSRALARLREATGDPLLVRAGRGLVPTPRAIELRGRVGQLVEEAQAVLRPVETLDLKRLVRTFTFRNREGFVENFGSRLLARLEGEAPGVRIRFVPKPDKESTPLRDGGVDLETGVVGDGIGPEMRAQALFRDRLVGVVRVGHPLCGVDVTPERYSAGRHILVSRRGYDRGPIDDALELQGLMREIATVVGMVVFAILWARRGWWIPPMLMAVAFIFEKFGQMLLSAVVARPSLPLPGWGSYPSGGVARILVTYGMIMYLVVLTWPRISRAWRVTGFTVVVMLAWIESFTRIYVQKHYLMDVVGGWIFGPLLLLALIAGASCFRQVDATTGTDEAIDRENAAV